MRLICSLLLASVFLGISVSHAQVERDVSDITGVERIESESMRSLYDETYAGDHASFRAAYVHDPDEGASWILTVYGFTDDTTQVSRTTQFFVQADGRQISPIQLESKTRPLDGTLMEIKRAVFTRSDFEAIATAQDDVTISIGSAEFIAVRPRLKDLRLLLDRVPSSENPQTASNDSSK